MSTYLSIVEPTILLHIMSRLSLLFALVLVASACTSEDSSQSVSADAPAEEAVDLRSEAAEGARVFFVGIEDGATVTSPFTVEFGLEDMTVAPAGTDEPFSGHHHLLINQEELPALDMPLPSDSLHIHYGMGQTTAELDLPAGTHTLQIVLGNHLHIPHNPPVVSEKITVTVQ